MHLRYTSYWQPDAWHEARETKYHDYNIAHDAFISLLRHPPTNANGTQIHLGLGQLKQLSSVVKDVSTISNFDDLYLGTLFCSIMDVVDCGRD